MVRQHLISDDQVPSVWDSSRDKLHRNVSAYTWVEVITWLNDAVEKELGSEGKKVYDATLYNSGKDCAWDILRYFGKSRTKWGEPLTGAMVMHMMNWLLAYKDEVIVREKDMAVVRVTFSPNLFRSPGGACRLNTYQDGLKTKAFRLGLIEGINPFLTAIPVKSMLAGDDVSEWLITTKDSEYFKEYNTKKKEDEPYPEIDRVYKGKTQPHDHLKKCYPVNSGSMGGIMIMSSSRT